MTLEMWPKQNTAFVVIHGMGSNRPFDYLDSFVSNFLKVLKCMNQGTTITCHHQLLRHKDWIESYISLTADNAPSHLDFYEYYWDCFMVREIKYAELLKWLELASEGAKNFYAAHPELVTDHPEEDQAGLFKDITIKHSKENVTLSSDDKEKIKKNIERNLNYSRTFLHNIWWMKLLHPVIRCSSCIEMVMKILKPCISKWLCNRLQDLVIYTTADVRSKNYAIRQLILEGIVDEIKLLIKQDCKIVLAGESLGSVIAYDAINQVNLDMNVGGGLDPGLSSKIGGLVTFASPLDKIYFLFKEQAPGEQYLRRQIVSQLYSYRTVFPQTNGGTTLTNPIADKLDKSIWVNYYHRNDLVGGFLDAYKPNDQVQCYFEADFFKAHTSFKTYAPMYLDIALRYF